jgi:hypothetical protein
VGLREPVPGVDLSDDEIAGATSLRRWPGTSLEGGPGPYPFADAAQDQYLSLCIERRAPAAGW